MPGTSVTTKSVHFSSTASSSPTRSLSPERMCFRAEPVRHNGNYYYREEYHQPTRRHHHHTHAHYSRSSRSSVPVYVTHSPRVSTSSYRVASASPVMYETRTSTTRYRN